MLPVKPPLAPDEKDHFRSLGVIHPYTDKPILHFAARTALPSEDETGEPQMTISHLYVLRAAEVITQQPGFLSTSRRREDPGCCRSPALAAGRYYFHLADATAPAFYPICASFADWTPPLPEDIPPEWSFEYDNSAPGFQEWPCGDPWLTWEQFPSTVTMMKILDKRCPVTARTGLLELVHVVPEEEHQWLTEHDIIENVDPHTWDNKYWPYIDNPRNMMLLDPTVARLFQAGHLSLVPMPDSRVVAYCTRPCSLSVAAEYHLREVRLPKRIPPPLLYYRFAWSIFEHFAPLRRPREPSVYRPLIETDLAVLPRRDPTTYPAGSDENSFGRPLSVVVCDGI